MTRYGETEGDDLFRADAARLGYLEDAHEPGDGRGLWAYYRDHGIQPPAFLEKVVPARESNGYFGGTPRTSEEILHHRTAVNTTDLTGRQIRTEHRRIALRPRE